MGTSSTAVDPALSDITVNMSGKNSVICCFYNNENHFISLKLFCSLNTYRYFQSNLLAVTELRRVPVAVKKFGDSAVATCP
jgi:hypothetical protein